MNRHADLVRFYEILGSLEYTLGGKRILADCDGRLVWPDRGVYFFFEPGETRSDTGSGPRVVRVGTHALKAASGTSLLATPVTASRDRGYRRRQSSPVDISYARWCCDNGT